VPEGDTIHQVAAVLGPRLTGATIARGHVRGRPEIRLDGCRVTGVRAHGKHLYIRFDDGTALRSHLGMWGSWHRYAADEPWRKPARHASVEIDLGDEVLVCFHAQEVELVREGSVRARHLRTRLGPDLLVDGVDPASIPPRARHLLDPETVAADVLLDQRVTAGIGNVYKSEVLFLHGVHPLRTLGSLEDAELGAMFATAADLLRRNLRGGRRVTRFEGSGGLWVYGRRGRACHRCGTPISLSRLGRDARDTYWCPRCQPAGAEG